MRVFLLGALCGAGGVVGLLALTLYAVNALWERRPDAHHWRVAKEIMP